MRIFVAAALSAALAGCASVTRGWDEQISIATTPSGATASFSGTNPQPPCTTPCVIKVKRSDDITVTVEKEGFEKQIIPLTKEVTATGGTAFVGNILLGGVVGGVVDAASGAALDHKPNPVIVTMEPVKRAPPPPRPQRRRNTGPES